MSEVHDEPVTNAPAEEIKPEAVTPEETPEPPVSASLNEDTAEAVTEQSPPVAEKEETSPEPAEEKEATQADHQTSEKEDGTKPVASTTSSGKKKIPFKYHPDKVTLRFLFANRDGLSVTVDCAPADTVGEVKGALLSVWPKELPGCGGGDRLRLICMGKGILMPDTRTLEDCQVPTFKTHPTPINVSVRPEQIVVESEKTGGASSGNASGSSNRNGRNGSSTTVEQGCSCVIL